MTSNAVLTFVILFIAAAYGREYVTYYYSTTAGCPSDVTNAPVKISQATGLCMLRFPAPGSRIFSCNSTGITEKICTDTACSVGCTMTSVLKDSCGATPYGSFFQTCGEGAVDGSYAPSFVGSQYEDGSCTGSTGPAAVYVAKLDTCIGPYATFVQNFGQTYTCPNSVLQYKNCSSSDCSASCGSLVPYPSGCQNTARNLVSGSSEGVCSTSDGTPQSSQPSSSPSTSPVAQTPSNGPTGSQSPTGSQAPTTNVTPSSGPSAKTPQTKASDAHNIVVSFGLAFIIASFLQ